MCIRDRIIISYLHALSSCPRGEKRDIMSPKGGLDVKKRILFIGTGGTIASEMSDEGLLPGVGASALLGYVPDVAQLCDVDSVQLYELDSTNIGPEEWLGLASTIRNNYTRFDGFVISHGTDTVSYTHLDVYKRQRCARPGCAGSSR